MKRTLPSLLGFVLIAAALTLWPSAGAKALTVSPPYFDYNLNPGDTVLDVIKLYNESPDPISVWPVLMNFTADDKEEGAPQFYEAGTDPYGTQLADWITVDKKPIKIGPYERANVSFAINVPKDRAQPGGHFGAVMLSMQPPDAKAGVGIGSQIAALILVNISGDVREVGSIAQFGFKDPKAWYNYLPVDFFLRFQNSGNTHLRPVGNLLIYDWIGRQVASIKVNQDFRSVLPQSIRRFEFGWQNTETDPKWSGLEKEWRNFAFGKYKAVLVLNYGQKNQIVTDEREFTVWPWRLMLIGAGIVLVLFLIFKLIMKAYKKSIIKNYEKMHTKEGQGL